MMLADLKRLHKYMLEIENISVISDEMRGVVEELWPELAHKLPPKKPIIGMSAFGGIPDMRCRLALMACAGIDPERSLQLRRSTGILAFANVNCLAHRAKGLLHVRRFSASDHRCRGAPGHIAWRSAARQRIPPDRKRGPTARDGATFANRGSAPPAALPVACGF
jgi:hypothetical protein